jgi:hypothetical protein
MMTHQRISILLLTRIDNLKMLLFLGPLPICLIAAELMLASWLCSAV